MSPPAENQEGPRNTHVVMRWASSWTGLTGPLGLDPGASVWPAEQLRKDRGNQLKLQLPRASTAFILQFQGKLFSFSKTVTFSFKTWFLRQAEACSHVAPVPFRTLPLSWCAILALPQFCLSLGSPKGRRRKSSSQGRKPRQAGPPGRPSVLVGAEGVPPTKGRGEHAHCVPTTQGWVSGPDFSLSHSYGAWCLLNETWLHEFY